ncbi:MAG: topoisomerase IV [Oscillospiraceae bacterium]|nr:topoisomerase IV [Oscillospiraceae bacterium]
MKKTNRQEAEKKLNNPSVMGLHGETTEQAITDTLEQNYMPYAMSVIVSRAIPEIDGFKPSHRKLLYTMYKMGLLNGARTKSANIVGQTMKLNPHGDAAIYETMVRLSVGNQSLLVPFVDSKGNFGKVYSRDMSYAASRYTEAKLSKICSAVFGDIDLDSVDFVDNYDGTMKEPTLLPTAFPNVLVSANSGIAVGMASQICGFNLNEVCNAAIAVLRDGDADLLSLMPAPDFPTGGEILYDRSTMETVYRTGRGSIPVRAKWRYLAKENLIEITEIPYTTTCEAILDKVADLVKTGKIREINDMRDETDLSGLRLAIDLKRGTDPDKLMQKLFRSTTLQDAFPCNFNILIEGNPRVMGVREILDEWIAWRTECVRRRIFHDLSGKKDKLHLLEGLKKILLDIDKAIEIIRNTELETDVVPNLMMGFGIDEVQAEYVAEIRLRNINREYILKRTAEIEALEQDIEELESILNSRRKLKNVLITELNRINKQFQTPRRSSIIYVDELPETDEEEPVNNDPVTVFLSEEGYFKKITPQSLRMSSEQKFKEGDSLRCTYETTNAEEVLFLTNRQQVYKLRLAELEPCKASALGSYIPTLLKLDEGETVLDMLIPGDYSGSVLFAFENGKIARVALDSYQTKTNRRKLMNAYSDKSPLVAAMLLKEDTDIVCYTDDNRALVLHTSLLTAKPTRNTQGVSVALLKGRKKLAGIKLLSDSGIQDAIRYRARSIPRTPTALKQEDQGAEQLSLL